MDLSFALKLGLVDKASGGIADLSKRMAKMGDTAKAMGERWQKTGEALSQAGDKVTAFADRGRAAIEGIVAPAMEVETAMAELAESIPNDNARTAESLAKLRDAAIDWSTSHTQSAAEYLAAARQIMAAGLSEADAVSATSTAMRLQRVAGGDAAAIGRTLAVVYGQLGDKTKPASEELARLGDMLAVTKRLFPTIDVGALTDPLKDASPIAKQLGVDFGQVAASLGALNAAGLQGGEAGAKLSGLMTGLSTGAKAAGVELRHTANGGLDLVGSLSAIEAKFGKVETMSPATRAALEKAFGPDAFKTMTMLLGQTDKLSEAHQRIADSAGAAGAAQARLESTTASQAKIAGQQLDALKLEVAAGLAPALKELVPLAKSAITSMTDFAKAHPGLMKIGGTLAVIVVVAASILGPLMVAVGGFILFAGTVMAVVVPALAAAASAALAWAAAMLANPITWIIIAIVALAVLLYVYWEPISGFFVAIWQKISTAFSAAAALMREVWTAAKGAVVSIFTDIKTAFQGSFVGGVMAVLALLNPGAILGRVFAAVLPILARVWQSIIDGIHSAASSAIAAVAEWWQGIVNRVHGAADSIRQSLAESWAGMRADLFAAFAAMGAWFEETFVGGIRSDLAEVGDAVRNFSLLDAGRNIINTLVSGMKSAANLPADTMNGIVQSVRDYLPFSPAKVGPLRDIHKIRLVETIAESISPDPLVAAMSNVAGAAISPLTAPPSIPSLPASSSASSGAAAAGPATFVFNFSGSDRSPVEQLEAWLRDPANAGRVFAAAEAGRARRDRGALE